GELSGVVGKDRTNTVAAQGQHNVLARLKAGQRGLGAVAGTDRLVGGGQGGGLRGIPARGPDGIGGALGNLNREGGSGAVAGGQRARVRSGCRVAVRALQLVEAAGRERGAHLVRGKRGRGGCGAVAPVNRDAEVAGDGGGAGAVGVVDGVNGNRGRICGGLGAGGGQQADIQQLVPAG